MKAVAFSCVRGPTSQDIISLVSASMAVKVQMSPSPARKPDTTRAGPYAIEIAARRRVAPPRHLEFQASLDAEHIIEACCTPAAPVKHGKEQAPFACGSFGVTDVLDPRTES